MEGETVRQAGTGTADLSLELWTLLRLSFRYFCPHVLFSISPSWYPILMKTGSPHWAKNLHVDLLQCCWLCWIKSSSVFLTTHICFFPAGSGRCWCLVSEAWQRICILWHFYSVLHVWGMGHVTLSLWHITVRAAGPGSKVVINANTNKQT